MKKKLFSFIICLFATIQMMAQGFTLQGRVTDQDNNPIELATVSVVKQGKVAFTSLKGEFSLHLQSADSVAVKFTMIGYKPKVRVLRRPRGKQTLQVVLYTDDNILSEVQVTGQKIQTGQTEELKTEDTKLAPSASGNAVEGLIQQQAGVSTHNELSSQYNVRGGAFDENSVYINNVEIYRPFLVRSGQQEGLSIINPYMVDKIGFSTGGYAAKYGDKMSSALDITYKKLEPKGSKKSITEGTLSASLLGADAYFGLGTKKLSWLNSVRYKTNRYLLGSTDTKGEYKPNFLDYQTYLSYSPNKRWKVDFIGNISDNHYNFTPKDRETTFGTQENVKSFRVYFDGHEKDRFLTYFGTLGITRNITDKTSISLLGSAFYTKEQEKYDIQGQYWLDQTETSENLGVGTYFEHARNYLSARVLSAKLMLKHKTKKHDIEMAYTYKKEHISENSVEYEMRDSAGYSVPHNGKELYMIYSMRANNTLDANRMEAYLQDTYRFTSKGGHTHFTLNYGVRMSHWSFNKETIVSPRVSLGIIPAYSENTTFRFAAILQGVARYLDRERHHLRQPQREDQESSKHPLHRRLRLPIPHQQLALSLLGRGILQGSGQLHPLLRQQREGGILRREPCERSCHRYRPQALRRVCTWSRLLAHLLADEHLDETQRQERATAYRPAIRRQPLLHRLLPRNGEMENVIEASLGRRTAILHPTQGVGDQHVPCASLQASRHRHELSPARQQQAYQEDVPPQHLARRGLSQPIRHRQCEQLLLGDRCNQPTVCCT